MLTEAEHFLADQPIHLPEATACPHHFRYPLAPKTQERDGASFLGDAVNWENKVETGKGWAYGAEFLFEKKIGKTSGWIGYTLAWSTRQFDNLNFGKPFPYKYDRRKNTKIR